MPAPFRLGVIGYSGTPFDVDAARRILRREIGRHGMFHQEVEVVSGLTALGIPLLAYEVAAENGYLTVGVACKKAEENPCWPCDEVIIVGEEWGDESETFLSRIDYLLKVGGGKQSVAEFARFTGTKEEFFLPPLTQ